MQPGRHSCQIREPQFGSIQPTTQYHHGFVFHELPRPSRCKSYVALFGWRRRTLDIEITMHFHDLCGNVTARIAIESQVHGGSTHCQPPKG